MLTPPNCRDDTLRSSVREVISGLDIPVLLLSAVSVDLDLSQFIHKAAEHLKFAKEYGRICSLPQFPSSIASVFRLQQTQIREPCSFSQSLFNLAEIANRPFISSIRADGNRDGPKKNPSPGSASKAERFEDIPQSSDSRSSLSSNKEEILALFKRIQSSISKGETVSSKKRISKAAEDKPSLSPSAESILEVLHQSRTPAKGRTVSKKRDICVAPEKDLLKEEREEDLSTAGLKSTRPPSRFTRKSPIPSLSTPKEVIQPENETLPATPALSIPRDEIELKNDEDNGQESLKFDEMKLHQLKEVAKSKGIKGYSKLKKSELVDLLIRSLNDVSP